MCLALGLKGFGGLRVGGLGFRVSGRVSGLGVRVLCILLMTSHGPWSARQALNP